jgi:uncharacterized protein
MVTITVIEAENLFAKIRGQIGKKNAAPMLFRTRFGIHTFGMRVPIDVIVLNSNHQIVALKSILKPFRVFLWNPKYSIVIELPAGTIEKMKLSMSGKINLIVRQ